MILKISLIIGATIEETKRRVSATELADYQAADRLGWLPGQWKDTFPMAQGEWSELAAGFKALANTPKTRKKAKSK